MRERSYQINFRATKTEKEKIHRKAKRCGMTDADYIRNCALDKPVTEMPREGLQIAYRKVAKMVYLGLFLVYFRISKHKSRLPGGSEYVIIVFSPNALSRVRYYSVKQLSPEENP